MLQSMPEESKDLKAIYIAFLRPNLIDQLKSNKLLLFRNVLT